MFTFTCFRCRNGETGMGVISDTRSSRDESLLKKYSLHSQCTRLSAWTLLVSEMKKPGKFQVGKRKFWGIMSGPAQPLMLTLKGHFFFYAFFTQHCISITVPSHILYSQESCDILLKQKLPTQNIFCLKILGRYWRENQWWCAQGVHKVPMPKVPMPKLAMPKVAQGGQGVPKVADHRRQEGKAIMHCRTCIIIL